MGQACDALTVFVCSVSTRQLMPAFLPWPGLCLASCVELRRERESGEKKARGRVEQRDENGREEQGNGDNPMLCYAYVYVPQSFYPHRPIGPSACDSRATSCWSSTSCTAHLSPPFPFHLLRHPGRCCTRQWTLSRKTSSLRRTVKSGQAMPSDCLFCSTLSRFGRPYPVILLLLTVRPTQLTSTVKLYECKLKTHSR